MSFTIKLLMIGLTIPTLTFADAITENRPTHGLFGTARSAMQKLTSTGTHYLGKAGNYLGGKVGLVDANSELRELAEATLAEVASFQDFIFFTVKFIDGRPFLDQDYLDVHCLSQTGINIQKMLEGIRAGKQIGELVDLAHLFPEQQSNFFVHYIDLKNKLQTYPDWFELRKMLLCKGRMENQLIKDQSYILSRLKKPIRVIRENSKILPVVSGEPNFDQIDIELAASKQMVDKESKLWESKVEPFLAKFEQLNGWMKKSWENAREMHEAIGHDLRLRINSRMREMENTKIEQKRRIALKFDRKVEEKHDANLMTEKAQRDQEELSHIMALTFR